jgi:hypothetical protein
MLIRKLSEPDAPYTYKRTLVGLRHLMHYLQNIRCPANILRIFSPSARISTSLQTYW